MSARGQEDAGPDDVALAERARRIEESRRELSRSWQDLKGTARERLSPREVVRRHPFALLGAAAAAGLLAGLAGGRSRRQARATKVQAAPVAAASTGGAIGAFLGTTLARTLGSLLVRRATPYLQDMLLRRFGRRQEEDDDGTHRR